MGPLTVGQNSKQMSSTELNLMRHTDKKYDVLASSDMFHVWHQGKVISALT